MRALLPGLAPTCVLSYVLACTLACVPICLLVLPANAQRLIGYVPSHDAEVSGASDVLDGEDVLTGSVSVTAKDHTAPIRLGRGGTVLVCQSSQLHLTESREMMVAAPLLFSLDRGAIEIHTKATPTDEIMTPDLRFTARGGGPLDLRLRVAADGDTCVNNRGADAPIIIVTDPFGDATYELTAEQHVLFEHGNLHDVVDSETSPCGCPDDPGSPGNRDQSPDALADSRPAASTGRKPTGPASRMETQAARQHPFPVAISEGLAPTAEVPQATPGVVHTQVSESLSYNAQAGAQDTPPATAQTDSRTAAAPIGSSTSSAASTPMPPKRNLVHRIGHFFRRLFRRV